MIFFYSLCGIGVVAVGLGIGELIHKPKRAGIQGKQIDARKADTMVAGDFRYGGLYLPSNRDDRPPH